MGVCTSSATVGHSLSFGKADAVVAVARDVPLADACATSYCNLVKSEGDIERVLTKAEADGLLEGIVIILGEHLGAWGNLQLL